jgi:hypothetical protein
MGTAQKRSVGSLLSTSSALTNRVAPCIERRKKTREGEERGVRIMDYRVVDAVK